jgi:two-component system phosphate regulon sensor histidine kinase PhoR
LLLSRDISERERLERMRSDFVAIVSHELRTPLTVMAGFLETMHETDIAGGSKPEASQHAGAGGSPASCYGHPRPP